MGISSTHDAGLKQSVVLIREDVKFCKPIHFDGNGYSDEWVEEAKRRGLDCETSCPKIFERYLDEATIKMFESQNLTSSRTTSSIARTLS